MKPLSRRSVIAGSAAAVTALPTLGLCKVAESGPVSDPLLEGIRRYQAEIAALNATDYDLADEESDGWVDQADTILEEAIQHPVQTEQGARAVIGLVLEEPILLEHAWFEDRLPVLVKDARRVLALT